MSVSESASRSPQTAGNPMLAQLDPAPTARSDEELLREHLAGQRESFAILVHRYEKELFHFLARFLGDRQAAEDVFQETFLQIHQSAGQFDPQRRFRPWLFTIAANKARDQLRNLQRKHAAPLEAALKAGDEDSGQYVDLIAAAQTMPESGLEREEVQLLVQKTVAELPANLREILLHAYFHNWSYKHIAEIMNIPLGTVKSRLHTAVAAFAQRWRKNKMNRSGE
jgi:RNA polymerase sigma-70 factor (ECF subfamily)